MNTLTLVLLSSRLNSWGKSGAAYMETSTDRPTDPYC